MVSTLNLVLHGIRLCRSPRMQYERNIKKGHHDKKLHNLNLQIFPVVGINLYHVSVALQSKYYYGIESPTPADESDNTIWDYDMTYALTFGVVTTFNIGDQTFGVPLTFTKHGFSTVGLLIKINRNKK